MIYGWRMETRIPRVLFARLLACEINLHGRVRVACKYTCEDVNLLQVCTICMYVYTYARMYVCMYVCTYVCMHVYMHGMYVCVYVCIYVCM